MNTESEKILTECLSGQSFGWENFVDHCLPQVTKVVESCMLESGIDIADMNLKQRLVTAVFRQLRQNDFQLLREFDNTATLTTYVSIIGQRVANQSLTN
ncbi:MAG TPA: hypothetical protein PKD64_06725 [Pirellulaceae bacterium]|nr:hypothetical protein [Pirellulaceae bacterium]HMO91877.1 hypothetical protein [Pirellulaceae bacterium]HMP69713.1 hypothetical protein [Pirellulaceae bacterium]